MAFTYNSELKTFSVFIGHVTVHDLEVRFNKGLALTIDSFIMQVSMDGAIVNQKFFGAMRESVDADPRPLELGSCLLHVIHGVFQVNHKLTGWSVDEMLRSMYVRPF